MVRSVPRDRSGSNRPAQAHLGGQRPGRALLELPNGHPLRRALLNASIDQVGEREGDEGGSPEEHNWAASCHTGHSPTPVALGLAGPDWRTAPSRVRAGPPLQTRSARSATSRSRARLRRTRPYGHANNPSHTTTKAHKQVRHLATRSLPRAPGLGLPWDSGGCGSSRGARQRPRRQGDDRRRPCTHPRARRRPAARGGLRPRRPRLSHVARRRAYSDFRNSTRS